MHIYNVFGQDHCEKVESGGTPNYTNNNSVMVPNPITST